MTPFFIDRGTQLRLPLSPPHRDLAAGKSLAGSAADPAMEATVRELLAAAKAARKATLDEGRGRQGIQGRRLALLRTKELPRSMRCSPTVNVDLLKPVFERAGAPSPRGS